MLAPPLNSQMAMKKKGVSKEAINFLDKIGAFS